MNAAGNEEGQVDQGPANEHISSTYYYPLHRHKQSEMQERESDTSYQLGPSLL